MDTTPVRKTRRAPSYAVTIPRTRFKVRESRCQECLGSGTRNKTRLPGGALWVEPCGLCNGAGVVEREIEA